MIVNPISFLLMQLIFEKVSILEALRRFLVNRRSLVVLL